jgi:toxin YoeB
MLKRINELLKDISRSPHDGIEKREPLKHALGGYWSRRINDEHRLVYRVEGDAVKVAQARFHYE